MRIALLATAVLLLAPLRLAAQQPDAATHFERARVCGAALDYACAEDELALARKDDAQRMSAMQALQGLMAQASVPGEGGGGELFSWQKDRVADVKVVVDGQPFAGVRITREAGERLGFRPGDVICVSTAPPATASAPAMPGR